MFVATALALLVQVPVPEASPAKAATQARVDRLIARCDAASLATLIAQSGSVVEFLRISDAASASPSDNQKVECVLTGIDSMDDLLFAFAVDDPPAPVEKKK
jgi:hypothetical protein